MSSVGILYAKVVDDEYKHDWPPLVTPQAWCGSTLVGKILFLIPSGTPSPHCYPNNTTSLRLCLIFEDTFILLSPYETTH